MAVGALTLCAPPPGLAVSSAWQSPPRTRRRTNPVRLLVPPLAPFPFSTPLLLSFYSIISGAHPKGIACGMRHMPDPHFWQLRIAAGRRSSGDSRFTDAEQSKHGAAKPKLSFKGTAASAVGLESATERLVFGTTVPEDLPNLVSPGPSRMSGVGCFCQRQWLQLCNGSLESTL